MTTEAEELLARAQSLSADERVMLAARLLESVDAPPDAEHDALWWAEVSRRHSEMESGQEPGIPLEEARRQAFGP